MSPKQERHTRLKYGLQILEGVQCLRIVFIGYFSSRVSPVDDGLLGRFSKQGDRIWEGSQRDSEELDEDVNECFVDTRESTH